MNGLQLRRLLLLGFAFLASVPSARAQWAMYPVPVEEVSTSSTGESPGTAFAALLDGEEDTSWVAAAQDSRPWIELRFAAPTVVTSLRVINGWRPSTNDWSKHGRAHELELATSSGETVTVELEDVAYEQIVSVPLRQPMTSLRVSILSRHGDASGSLDVSLSEFAPIGRFREAGAPTLEKLGSCTVVLDRELVIEPGQRQASPTIRATIYKMDEPIDWNVRVLAKDTSSDRRTIRAGRRFEATTVRDRAEALVLECADGTRITLSGAVADVERSLTSITGQLTLGELSHLFAGSLHFEDVEAAASSEY